MLETETFADFDDLGDPEHDAPHASDIKACDELLARLREHHSPNGRPDHYARPATPPPIKLVAATPRPQGDPGRAVALAARSLSKTHRRIAAVIFAEILQTGSCALLLDEIAAKAECSRGSVRGALREAEKLNLIRVQERRSVMAPNLPHVITLWTQHVRDCNSFGLVGVG
jgi:hypothetical protein